MTGCGDEQFRPMGTPEMLKDGCGISGRNRQFVHVEFLLGEQGCLSTAKTSDLSSILFYGTNIDYLYLELTWIPWFFNLQQLYIP
ncbi:MAG: hypothetical protein CMI26_10440 [Opitutae bacterium]|nr:hypothetical protein [Opitutae bacterium]